MEYKSQGVEEEEEEEEDEEEEEEEEDDDDDEEIDHLPSSTALGYGPSSVRGSAFSKPVLSPSSSLISLGGGGAAGDGVSAAENVACCGAPTTPSSSSLHGAAAAVLDRSSESAVRNVSSDPGGATALPDSKSTAAGAAAVAGKNSTPADVSVRYRECLRNHAAAIGGHVVDGCGEFMPEGSASAAEALKCAACGCHRSFHRKDSGGGDADESYYRSAAAPRLPLLLPPPPHPHAHPHAQPHHHHHLLHHLPRQFQFGSPTTPSSGVMAFASASGGTTTESSSEEKVNAGGGLPTPATGHRKRFRTKFSAEQKEKMQVFAERVGWRLQKQDEALVEQFCGEAGVRRHVFKVWMHNNKHLIKKQQQPPVKQDEDLPPQQQQQQQQQL